MPRAKVVEVDYYAFAKMLRRATDAGAKIERADAAAWTAYVKEHEINEVAATAIAKQKFEKATPVILAEGQDTDGLYFHSKDEEGCLRLVPLE
jgi:hypothetical protein